MHAAQREGWRSHAVHGVALLVGICVVPFLIVVARQRTTAGFLGALVFAAVPLVRKVPLPGLELLLAGGLAYTLGVLFFVLDSRLKYAHTVWHGFVTLGTGSLPRGIRLRRLRTLQAPRD